MKAFFAIFKKDFLVEFRGFDSSVPLIGNAILVSCIAGAGVSSAFLTLQQIERIFPMLFWTLFLLIGAISCSRGNDAELEHRGFEGLILSKIWPGKLFASKVIVTSFILFIGYLTLLCALFVFLGVSPNNRFITSMLLGVAAIPSFASVSVLLLSMSSVSKLKGVLHSLIVLPLLFPLFFACTEISAYIFEPGLQSAGTWWSMIFLMDLVYFLLGINLYQYTIVE